MAGCAMFVPPKRYQVAFHLLITWPEPRSILADPWWPAILRAS